MANEEPQFSKIRSVLWPIHNFELKKFLPMSFLMFSILFVYSAVRDLKDVFIQSYAVMGGTELIAPLKGLFVLPMALVVAVVFAAILSKFGMHKTFYITVSFFAIFFFIFAFFLFPNYQSIHWSAETMTNMLNHSPKFMRYIIPCFGNWSFSLFFILAETWGSLAIGSLFWFFANQITKKSEASRFYALFSLIGNIGVYAAGKYIETMSKTKDPVEFNRNVKILISIAVAFCIITMLIYSYINKVVLADPRLYDPTQIKKKKKKAKVGFLAGIKVILSSKYLFLIFMLPICYGVGMNIYEGIFKAHIKAVSKSPADVSLMMGRLSQITAISTIFLTFLSTYILGKFKWKYAALVTPTALLSLGAVFFLLMINGKMGVTTFLGMSLPMFALGLGMFVDAFSKGVKYCLFDTTKSIAYRPLDPDTQAQGQAAVEIVGGRGGKGLGAFISMMFTVFMFPGSKLLDHVYSFFVIFIVILVLWIFSCIKLGGMYEQKVKEQEQQQA